MERGEDLGVKKNLYYFNLSIGIFHLFEAAFIWLLASQLTFVITGTYLNLDEISKVAAPLTRDLFEVKIGNLIALFLLGAAMSHIIICVPKIYELYFQNLGKGLNYIRWVEYTVTASLMTIIIGMLSGIYDLSSLILLFGVSAATTASGFVVELFEKFSHSQAIRAFWAACLIGLLPWVVILIHIAGARSSALQSVDNFVYLIVFSLLAIFSLFPINNYLALRKLGPWKNYYFVETCYIALSWIAKSALAWQIYLGTLS
jgi:Heliorhodopsin